MRAGSAHFWSRKVVLSTKLNHMQSMCMLLTCVTCALSDVDWKAHNANLPHNVLAKWTCFKCSNTSFCSLLVSEPLCVVILAISGHGALFTLPLEPLFKQLHLHQTLHLDCCLDCKCVCCILHSFQPEQPCLLLILMLQPSTPSSVLPVSSNSAHRSITSPGTPQAQHETCRVHH